jgi:hypothetical protein
LGTLGHAVVVLPKWDFRGMRSSSGAAKADGRYANE